MVLGTRLGGLLVTLAVLLAAVATVWVVADDELSLPATGSDRAGRSCGARSRGAD